MGQLDVIQNLDAWNARISAGVVICDFTATWCGPCKAIGPKFAEYAKDPDFAAIGFVKVDVDEAEEVAALCGVTAMPTFQVYKDGKKVDELVGANPDKLLALIKKYA